MVKVFNTAEETASEFAQFMVKDINASKEVMYSIALSGGSTPKLLFKILAERYAQKIDWQNVHFFWGDDRLVPAFSPESNYGEAKRLFFDPLKIYKKNIHPIDGLNDPDMEIMDYATEIKQFVPFTNGFPNFDLIMLGMGEDGHTASIFPNQMNLLASTEICEIAHHPESGQARITLTGNVINNAKKIVFLVNGESKADKISEIINKKGNYLNYPASHINSTNGELYWFLDKEAASRLDNKINY